MPHSISRSLLLAGGLAVCLPMFGGCDGSSAKRPRPGEPVFARLKVPEWRHGMIGMVQVRFEVQGPGDPEPVALDAEKLPEDFRPVVEFTFLSGGKPLGPPLEVLFDPDC